MSKVIILKPLKNGAFRLDTIYQDEGNISIDVRPEFQITADTIPVKLAESLEVNVMDKPKDLFKQTSEWVGLIGGALAGLLAIISILKLIRKDKERSKEITELGSIAFSLKSELENSQSKIDQLTEQTKALAKANEIQELKLKLSVKPKIWFNGGGYSAAKKIFYIDVNNKGKRAFFKSFEILDGHVDVLQFSPYELDTGQQFKLSMGPKFNNFPPNEITYKGRVIYEDELKNKFELIFEGEGGGAKIISDKEIINE